MKRKTSGAMAILLVGVPVLMAFYAWGGYQIRNLLQHPETWYSDLDHDPRVIIPLFATVCCATILMFLVAGALDMRERHKARRKAERKRAFDAAIASAERCIRERRFQEAERAVALATRIMNDNT